AQGAQVPGSRNGKVFLRRRLTGAAGLSATPDGVVMSRHRAITALAAALAIIATVSCGTYAARDEAQQYAERYFTARSGDDVAAALAFYSPKFFAGTPRDEWQATLQGLRE